MKVEEKSIMESMLCGASERGAAMDCGMASSSLKKKSMGMMSSAKAKPQSKPGFFGGIMNLFGGSSAQPQVNKAQKSRREKADIISKKTKDLEVMEYGLSMKSEMKCDMLMDFMDDGTDEKLDMLEELECMAMEMPQT